MTNGLPRRRTQDGQLPCPEDRHAYGMVDAYSAGA